MARPEQGEIVFEVDGREVRAPEGAMLVDAAKLGDVEIPYFCYEPKLGQPVGACRMCLVEIEGMPKLQTACSTPVKDGMVVTTTSDQVKHAQNAVVEFLLVNHPLDCPVCDKGGECPLQDISFGWGAGRSRFIEPKRHFKKPLELSPLVAIDRERCILCYRCVRFSQEVAEDHQLVFLERGDHTFVGTHSGRPYVAPFSGNIVELCPVGALTSNAYRFRARPWDIEDSGSLCALCPSQCNVKFTIRDDAKVVRVLARDNHEVDDGWLCDKGRFAYQAINSPERITAPLVRDGGYLREVSWQRALDEAASALEKAGVGAAALVGRQATNEEGFLVQHLLRNGLGSPHVDSAPGDVREPEQARVLARTDLAAKVSDIDHAGAVLVVDTELVDEAPILDLRVRKAVRRHGAELVVATSRPSSLDPNAAAKIRFAPGMADAVLGELAAALDSPRGGAGFAARGGAREEDVRVAADALRGADDVVILWGERVAHAERGVQGVETLLALAGALELDVRDESGLIEVPAGTNGRGLREVGCTPRLAPGLSDAEQAGMSAGEMARAELPALLLVHTDPVSDLREQELWEQAMERAGSVIAFSAFRTEALERHGHVVFPSESHAEKEGTLTHPDGRLQRLRQAIGHPNHVRAGWWVLGELCERAGAGLGVDSPPALTEKIAEAVPFYGGITLDQIGGGGVRWQERGASSTLPTAQPSQEPLEPPPELPGGLRLGVRPSLWAGPETRHSPTLRFLAAQPRAELSPDDARRLGVAAGDEVVVSVNGSSVRAAAAVRSGINAGDVFLIGGSLPGGSVEVTKA